jgi:hypothetical protein
MASPWKRNGVDKAVVPDLEGTSAVQHRVEGARVEDSSDGNSEDEILPGPIGVNAVALREAWADIEELSPP